MVRIAVVVQPRFGIYRRLSPSIALKRDFSTVFLTVNLAALDNKLIRSDQDNSDVGTNCLL